MTDKEPLQLPQLEAFAAVVRAGSISGAAEELFVGQPAVTARIQALERGIGTSLFVRGRAGSRLTEAGRALLPYVHRALIAVAAAAVPSATWPAARVGG